MAVSLGNLTTRVRRWVHQEDEDTSIFNASLVTDMINSAYRKRWIQLDAAHEGKFVQVATMDIVANQSRYSWPSGFVRLMKLEYVTEDGTQVPLDRDERHYSQMNPDTSFPYGSTCPYSFRPLSGGFTLEPEPQQAEGSLRIEYVATPAELQGNGDEIHADFPEVFSELIVLDAAVALLDSEGQLEDGQTKATLRAREELAIEWRRYINRLITRPQEIAQFTPHYSDA